MNLAVKNQRKQQAFYSGWVISTVLAGAEFGPCLWQLWWPKQLLLFLSLHLPWLIASRSKEGENMSNLLIFKKPYSITFLFKVDPAWRVKSCSITWVRGLFAIRTQKFVQNTKLSNFTTMLSFTPYYLFYTWQAINKKIKFIQFEIHNH